MEKPGRDDAGAATMPPTGSTAATETTGALARELGAELVGPTEIAISGLAPIDAAGPGRLTFIRSAKYAARWSLSGASAALVSRGVSVPGHDPGSRALLVVEDADRALQILLRRFAPEAGSLPPGIHPTALVDPSASIGAGAHVGPWSVVGPNTVVGDGAVLVAQVYLGADVSIGAGSKLHPGVRVLDRCVIGRHCELWPNVVIGADGFGYLPAEDGSGLLKVPHLGNVVIGSEVDVGAGSSIDRGKLGPTIVGDGTKIDNHCQIAHNCVIGRSVIICGMAGIAGSVTIQDGAVIAGHVGIADNLTIGERAVIAAKSGVISDVPAGEVWFGTPARPHREQMRAFAALRRLPDALRRLDRIEAALQAAGRSTGGEGR